jgi:hypothetical protein
LTDCHAFLPLRMPMRCGFYRFLCSSVR